MKSGWFLKSSNIESLLQKELMEKKWEHRYASYCRCIESVSITKIKNNDLIDVVVISWKENPLLDDVFEALRNQTFNDFRIVFVNNGGGQKLERFKDISDVYIELSGNTGAYFARNVGAAFSNAPVIVFLEDDGIPDKQLVEAHYRAHREFKDVVSVRGCYLPLTDNEFNKVQNHYYLGSKAYSWYCSLEGNSSFKADVFFKAGGWDDKIFFGHGGLELSYRLLTLGYGLKNQLYFPWAILFHDFAKSESHLASKRLKQRKGLDYISSKFPDIIRVRNYWRSYSVCLNSIRDFSSVDLANRAFVNSVERRNKSELCKYTHGKVHISFLDELISRASLNVCLYGAGMFGQSVANYLFSKGFKVKRFFDSDPSKWGATASGILIQDPSGIEPLNDIVLITSQWAEEIYSSISCDVNKYMVYGI